LTHKAKGIFWNIIQAVYLPPAHSSPDIALHNIEPVGIGLDHSLRGDRSALIFPPPVVVL
jgi:hypothetical protein